MSSSNTKPIIGLLGGPGSGKSHVARAFATLGCAVVDADRLAHTVLDEPEVVAQIRRAWGDDVVTRPSDGPEQIDRSVIAARVFEDPDALAQLEAWIHPRVLARRQGLHRDHRADPAVQAVIDDCPLLLEKGFDAACDVLVYVDAPRSVRLERLRQTRGWEPGELARREKNQLPLDTKRHRADYVLTNSGKDDLLDQARRLLSQILQNPPPPPEVSSARGDLLGGSPSP